MTSLNPQGCNPLLIPDILQSILDCIPHDVSRRQTLVALAQTCRSTSEPSLDRIWRKLRSLHPLLRCVIPLAIDRGDQDTEEEDQDSEGGDEDAEEEGQDAEVDELTELNPLTPAEWDVIARYSHRVQQLTVLFTDGLSLGFLKSIAYQPSPLFPNLRLLIWQPESDHPRPGSIAWIHPLLSPTLITLQARLTNADGEALRSFLQRYPHYCRNLKTVSLAFPPNQVLAQTTTYELSRAVCSHDRLVDLHVYKAPIDDAAMRQLSLSPRIEDLAVQHTPQKPIPRPYFRPEDTPFRHLRGLQLTTSDLDFVTTLLGSRGQILSTLHVQVHVQPTAEALSTFFLLLASSSSYTESIQSLLFKSNPPVPLAEESRAEEKAHVFRLSYQSLLPLMSFSHLRTLLVDWSDQISLDDNELVNMARGWPSMESLKIRCQRGEYPPQSMKYITCQGLLQLIIACPKLRELCLPLDAREVPTDTDPDVRNTAIRHLCFHESPIGRPLALANFICKHFPSVSKVTGKVSDTDTNSGPWFAVEAWLKFKRC